MPRLPANMLGDLSPILGPLMPKPPIVTAAAPTAAAPVAPATVRAPAGDAPAGLDPQIVNLAKAIRQNETGNRPIAGASGELPSRYQFLPSTWKARAAKYLGDPNAPITLENENKAMYLWIEEKKNAGFNPTQILSMHNAGEGRPNAYAENFRGKNSSGIRYDVPKYALTGYAWYRHFQYGEDFKDAFEHAKATLSQHTPSAPTPSSSEKRSFGGFMRNAGASGARFADDLINMAIHPVQTAKNLGKLALGAGEKLIPGEQGHEQYADALGSYYKERYGGFENIQDTFYNDPVGGLADLSTLLGGGAAVLKGGSLAANTAKATRAASAASTAANVAGKAAAFTDPLLAPFTAAGATARLPGVRGWLEGSAVRDWRSAAKIPKSIENAHPNADIPRIALEERAFVTPGGLEKTTRRLDDVNANIERSIAKSTASGIEVNPLKVAERADDLKPRFMDQVSPQDDLTAIEAKKQSFLAHPKYSTPSPQDPSVRIPKAIPAAEAQALKRGTYRELRGKYGTERNAAIETEKALARGLKEELAEQIPEISALNAEDSRLIALEDALQDAVRRISSRDRISMKTLVAMAADPRALVLAVVDHPTVKSIIAQIKFDAARGRFQTPSLPGSSNPFINTIYNAILPTRGTTAKTVINRATLQE